MRHLDGRLASHGVAVERKVYRRALQAGATTLREPADMFYGDRSAGVVDPLGNHWWLHTHIEDVSEEEMMRRAREQQGS